MSQKVKCPKVMSRANGITDFLLSSVRHHLSTLASNRYSSISSHAVILKFSPEKLDI